MLVQVLRLGRMPAQIDRDGNELVPDDEPDVGESD
jgi:hypothetical protein